MNQKLQALLAALAPRKVPQTIEGFGTVYIREIPVAEADEVAALAKQKEEGSPASDFGLNLLLRAVVDEADQPLFDADSIALLRASSGVKVDELVGRVLEVNNYKKVENQKNL